MTLYGPAGGRASRKIAPLGDQGGCDRVEARRPDQGWRAPTNNRGPFHITVGKSTYNIAKKEEKWETDTVKISHLDLGRQQKAAIGIRRGWQ